MALRRVEILGMRFMLMSGGVDISYRSEWVSVGSWRSSDSAEDGT